MKKKTTMKIEEIRKILDGNKVILNGKHQYIRPDDTELEMMGTTTISGMLPKEWMAAWAGKEAVKALGYFDKIDGEDNAPEKQVLMEKLAEISKLTPAQFYSLLKDSKGAHARKSKEARDFGTEGHNFLEKWIQAKIKNTESPKMTGEKWLDSALGKAIEWMEANVSEYIASEAIVCDLDNNIGGKLDLLARLKDETLSVIDFKFAAHIGADYFVQTAGYIEQLRWLGIDDPKWKRIILRLPKTETLIEYDKKKRVSVRVPNEFEVCEVRTSLEFDISTFLHLREAGRWVGYSKKFLEK